MNFSMIIILGVGCLFLAAAIALVCKMRHDEENCNVGTPATVVGFSSKEITNMDTDDMRNTKSTLYFPIFEFPVDGSMKRVTSSNGNGKMKFEIGQTVDLFYDPSDPDCFYVVQEVKSLRGLAVLFAVIFLALVVFALIIR